MRKFEVLEDCLCEGYLHERLNYPREGLVERKLKKGDIVEYVEEWSNFYGYYIRVRVPNEDYGYDISPSKLREIK